MRGGDKMENESGGDRQKRHTGIHQAILRLDDVADRLDSLSASISETPVATGPETKEESPSLETLLTSAADRIAVISQRIDDLTTDIRSKLF